MTPSARDFAYGIYGAWRLLHFDRGGLAYFDASVEGFWKSFYAALLVAPGYVIAIAIHLADREVSAGPLGILIVQLAAYVIGWTAFPVVMHALCQGIGRSPEYIGYIVAFNWSKVIRMLVLLPVIVIAAGGLLPKPLMQLVTLVAWVFVMAYAWYIARRALDLGGMGALGIVVLDFVIDVMITEAADGLLT